MLRKQSFGRDLARRAGGDEATTGKECQAVGVLQRERQLVHRREHRQRSLYTQLGHELERLLLAPDVECGRRLVQEQQRRFLRQRPREHDALLLAAAQRV